MRMLFNSKKLMSFPPSNCSWSWCYLAKNKNPNKIAIKISREENLNLLTFLMTETVGKFSLDYLVVVLCTTTYIVVDSALATTTTISDHIVSRNRWVAVRGASVQIAHVTFWFELTLKTYVCTRRSRCEVNGTNIRMSRHTTVVVKKYSFKL